MKELWTELGAKLGFVLVSVCVEAALAVAAPLRCESDEFEFMLAEPQSSRAVELNVFRENRDGASEKRKNPFQLHVQSSGFQFLSDSRMNL